MIEQIATTFFTVAVLMSLLGFFIKRWMDNIERKIDVQGGIIGGIKEDKLDKTECSRNQVKEEKENHEIWVWLKYHNHTADGHVIVPAKD